MTLFPAFGRCWRLTDCWLAHIIGIILLYTTVEFYSFQKKLSNHNTDRVVHHYLIMNMIVDLQLTFAVASLQFVRYLWFYEACRDDYRTFYDCQYAGLSESSRDSKIPGNSVAWLKARCLGFWFLRGMSWILTSRILPGTQTFMEKKTLVQLNRLA